MRRIRFIVVHCSASKDGRPKTLEGLVAEHKARGFRTVGYHYIVEPSGLRLVGRPEAEIGAHVAGHNTDSIGICMIGTKKFTCAAWLKLRDTVSELKAKYPQAVVCGHRDLSPDLNKNGKIEPNEWVKQCPSFDVATWVSKGMAPLDGQIWEERHDA